MEAYPVEFGHISHTGMRRANNQDNLASVPAANGSQFKIQGHIFLVADGMGGHLGGEKASELAVQIVPLTYAKNIQQGPAIALRLALQDANATINRRGNEAIHFYNMGTTCSVLALREEGAWVGHVGDSRVYRIRAKTIDQITFDHSFLWETARLRKVPPERVKDVMQNKIMRCLGPDQVVEVDIEGPHPLRPGDVFLLCSDGLSGPVGDLEMAQAAWLLPPKEACAYLAALANLRGGPDNITVQVVKLPGKAAQDNGQSSGGGPFDKNWAIILPCLLVSGILLAGVFFWASTREKPEKIIQIPALVASSLLTLGGMFGLLLRLAGKKTVDVSNPESEKAKIHRRESWKVTKENVQALADQVSALAAAGKDLPAMQLPMEDVHKALKQAQDQITSNNSIEAYRSLAQVLPRLEPVMRASHSKQIPAVPLMIPRPGAKT